MTLLDLLGQLERRAAEAEAVGATAPVANVYRLVLADLRPLADGNGGAALSVPGATWRERLWTCPPDTRLGVREVAEAVGRPRSWVYRACAAKRGPGRLRARRLDGELVLLASEVRDWLTRQEAPA